MSKYITPMSLPEPEEDTSEEIRDILKSTGALGEQVKANEKSKANANKAKGYAKAKSIGRKYG